MSPYERYRRQKHLLKSPSMRMLRRLTAMYASYLHLQLIDSPREWLSDLQTCRVTLKNVCATHRNPFHLQGACKQSAQTKICPPSRLSISFVHYFHRQYALHWFIWNILEFVYKRHFFERHTPPLSADQIHQQRGKKCTPPSAEPSPWDPGILRLMPSPISASSPHSPFPWQPRRLRAFGLKLNRNRKKSPSHSSTRSPRTSTFILKVVEYTPRPISPSQNS